MCETVYVKVTNEKLKKVVDKDSLKAGDLYLVTDVIYGYEKDEKGETIIGRCLTDNFEAVVTHVGESNDGMGYDRVQPVEKVYFRFQLPSGETATRHWDVGVFLNHCYKLPTKENSDEQR